MSRHEELAGALDDLVTNGAIHHWWSHSRPSGKRWYIQKGRRRRSMAYSTGQAERCVAMLRCLSIAEHQAQPQPR